MTPPPPPADGLRTRLQRFAARTLMLRPHRLRNRRPVVTFTFDDVPITSFTNGARVLDEHGVHGTFYVSGGLCRGCDDAAALSEDPSAISPLECRELHARGHEIGCHTFSHRHMRLCNGAVLHDEIGRNQAFFATMDSGIRLENFAYPYNAPTVGTKLRLQRHFASCRGGVPGINSGVADLGFLRAVEMCAGTTEGRIRDWIDAARRENGWLIFFSHDINERPNDWGVTPDVLHQAVSYAKASGCDVASVREALHLVGAAERKGSPIHACEMRPTP